jgi:phage head maturation protease
MLQNVQQSMEARDLDIKTFEAEIKAYSAETQRISAVQAGMSEEQIQDIAMGVVAAAMESQNLMMPEMREPEQGIPQ